jgi:hypothetical protein
MQETHQTYTYTARNANDPNQVVTFTLYNNHMRVNLTGLMERASQVAGASEKPAEIKRQLSTQAKPMVVKMVENFSGPAHIKDVDANLDDERLNVVIWQRTGGLRFAPIQFKMEKVDNTEAAEAFVDELAQRKKDAEHEGRLWGPLDYWLGWAGLLILMGVIYRWLRRRARS